MGVLPLFSVLGMKTTKKPDKNPKTHTATKALDKVINSLRTPTTKGPNAPPPEAPKPQTIPDERLDDFLGTTSPMREIVSGNNENVKKPNPTSHIIDGIVMKR